jgi:hypothetical protein
MLLWCWGCLLVLSLALGVGYCCCFCHTILFALFLYIVARHTSTPLSAAPHIVVPLALPLFSCCHSFCTGLLALLLLSCCSSCIIVALAFQAIASKVLLFFSHYHSWSFRILVIMFCLVSMVLPLPSPCASWSSMVGHQLKHQMWILLHLCNFFSFNIILVFFSIVFVLFLLLLLLLQFCKFFCPLHFVWFLFIMCQVLNSCASLLFLQSF